MKIELTQEPYICGGDYRLHTENGKPSISIVPGPYYYSAACDENGNDCHVVWRIKTDENGDFIEDGNGEYEVDWDHPEEVYSLETDKPVEDVTIVC